MSVTLRDIPIGETARVAGYARGASPVRDRLLSMGLTRGTDVTVVRSAPAGDPIELRTRGFSLTVRRAEASVLLMQRGSF
jgi:ferrous iron transport protein A